MQGKRVFVSGGAGVIGQEIVPRLLKRGATVLVGDLKPRPADFGPEVIYRRGDLNAMTTAEFEAFAPDVFIHLAATFERSTETYGFWEENFSHNVGLSHHLMTLAKDAPSLKRVVFASSYLIYDPDLYQFDAARDQPTRLKETDPILPRNLTGMAKLAHEIELRYLEPFVADRFSTVCARIYRGYGRNSRDVISRWIRALLKGEPLTVFRPEGLFDYIYAADTAEGLIRLCETGSLTGIINLGSGRARRVSEVIEILAGHFPDMAFTVEESDIPFEASEADLSLLDEVLGWRPVHGLEEAIPEMIAFERSRLAKPLSAPAQLKVLLSSASRKVPLLRALETAAQAVDPEAEVICGDANGEALTAHISKAFWQMPTTRPENLDLLIEGCRSRGVQLVLPTRDGELMFWAQNAGAFRQAGIEVLVSSPVAVNTCLDKLEFSRFGGLNNLPVIPTVLDLEDLPGDRFVVKERFGAGSRGVAINVDRSAARAHAQLLDQPIFQPYVAGGEISVDAWLDRKCRLKGLVLRRREVVVNGESQVTTTFRDPAIEAEAGRVLNALGLSGPVVLQIMISPDGRPHIIECNARFGGASTTGIAAGLDSLRWSLLEAQGEDLGVHPFHRIAGEVRQIRAPADVYDLIA
ncbi:MAG: epimerase [Alphaproteobacteria bacterium PA2]|nr:MAG: epimerase [Alphaproteobacteria bacterium PA2]